MPSSSSSAPARPAIPRRSMPRAPCSSRSLIQGIAARRPAHHHHRRRELSGLCRRHPGPLADGADAGAGRACRHRDRHRPHHRRSIFARRPFRLDGDSGDVYTADALIIATGAQARWLGLPSEQKFQGFGVSACATCDGFFYRGKEVVVVGGGNTAVEEALFLTNFASKVTVVHRRDSFRAENILQERLFAQSEDRSALGHRARGRARRRAAAQGAGARGAAQHQDRRGHASWPVDGVFIAIGHAPASELFDGQLEMKPAAIS